MCEVEIEMPDCRITGAGLGEQAQRFGRALGQLLEALAAT
jgi:hypothetical protein